MTKNYTKIYQSLSKQILYILDKYNIPPHKFIYTTSDIHKKAHDEILESIAQHVADSEDKNSILSENKITYEEIVMNNLEIGKPNKEDPNFVITSIIKTYLDDFFGIYFFTTNNELKLTKKELFDLPCKNIRTFDQFTKNEQYINDQLRHISTNPYRELALLILPDGTTYNAQNNHLTCSRWLNINGIDIDNAIRLETSKQFYDFNFCSLFNFQFSERSNDDELLNITENQAIIITDIYKTMCNAWKNLSPLEQSLHNCKGFGFSVKDYIPEIGEKNLRILDDHLGDFFNRREYMRNLKAKIKEIERLENNQKETI